MKELTCKITTFRKTGSKKIFTLDHKLENLIPGQLFLAYNSKKNSHLMCLNLFSVMDEVWFTYKDEYSWEVGDQLFVRGPIGEGFRPIHNYQNILLFDLESGFQSLNTLMEIGLSTGKNLVYSAKETYFPISPSVEIITTDLTEETLRWADFIALEVHREDLQKNNELLFKIRNLNIDCDVMVHCPILCSGKSDCMVCGLKTKKGWMKTCQQGQIVKLDYLEIE